MTKTVKNLRVLIISLLRTNYERELGMKKGGTQFDF